MVDIKVLDLLEEYGSTFLKCDKAYGEWNETEFHLLKNRLNRIAEEIVKAVKDD